MLKISLKIIFSHLLLGWALLAAAAENSATTQYHTQISFGDEAGHLTVDTRFIIPSTDLESNSVKLLLNRNFEFRNVEGSTLEHYSVNVSERVPDWHLLTLQFSDESVSHEVHISYSGVINAKDSHGNHIASESIHLSLDSGWHPVFADFSTPLQGVVKIDLPANWNLYGPGQVKRVGKTYHLTSEGHTIDVSLYATSSGNEVGSRNYTVVSDVLNEVQATHLAELGNECLSSLNRRFGATTALRSATMVLLERSGPSFARSNYLSVTRDALSDEQQSYHYICHELAHHWTTFGEIMSHDYWLVESFAEYVAASEVKSKFGVDAYRAIVERWEEQAAGHDFVWKADEKERASAMVNYALGPLALMELEQQIGEDTFNILLEHYMTTPLTETEALLSELERLSTKQTRQWFRQLLRGK